MNEVVALQKLTNCENVVKLLEIVHNSKSNEVNIVFEFCDQNLFQELTKRAQKN